MPQLVPATPAACGPMMYASARRQAGFPPSISYEDYERHISRWRLFFVTDESARHAIVSVVGNRVNVDALPGGEAKWCHRSILRGIFDEIFKHHDSVETFVHPDNRRAIRIVEKTGFRKIGEMNGFNHYLMRREDAVPAYFRM